MGHRKNNPTERALAECRQRGWVPARVEHFNAHSARTIDLFGFLDIVALDGKRIVGLQVTTAPHISDRRKKITGPCSEAALLWLRGGGVIEIWGWRQREYKPARKRSPGTKPRPVWELVTEEITLECFPADAGGP